MPRVTKVQAAHTYGVLDPHVVERRDTKFVGGSLSAGENIILLPQGGYTGRGGTTDKGRIRRALTAVEITPDIISLPNGGDENDLLAGQKVTTDVAAGARFVVAQLIFADPVTLHMIDTTSIFVSGERGDAALVAEYWTGTVWAAFGQPADIKLDPFSRRFASGAPGHAGITAAQFRICVDATIASGTVSLSGLAAFSEGAALADAIVRRFKAENAIANQLVFTPGNLDVFEAGVWKAAVPFLYTAEQLRVVKFEPRFDTILCWHRAKRPLKIIRMGNTTQWACVDALFNNLPIVDYGGVYTNAVNEVQEIQLYNVQEGNQFELTCEGLTTEAIERATVGGAATALNIKTALEALSNVDAGLTVTSLSEVKFRVEFTGDGNAGRDWLQMTATALSGSDDYVRVRTTKPGKAAGEDIMSDARGWPAWGRFAQQRLIMGGLPQRPNDIIGSVTGDPFNINTELDIATGAFVYEIDGSRNTQIHDMFVGTTLLFYGDEHMAFMKNNVLSADEVPQFGVSDTPGIKAETSPISSENAIFSIQKGGTTLVMTAFTELEQNFAGDNASVLSAFLIRDPVELFRRRAVGAVDSDLMVMINADGTMTVLTIMRTEEVSGFAPWSTDGKFVSGCVDHANEVWFICERLVNGVPELRLELHDPEKLLDEAAEINQAASSIISGLSRFNGRAVWVIANDSAYGPVTVEDGTIELDEAVTIARIGTWRAPFATDPEFSLTEETRNRMARLKRVNRAEISVLNTTSIAVQANDGPVVNLPLYSNDDSFLDTGPLARPLTGKVEAEGMHGFTPHGKLTVTQTYPGYLTVRSVTKDVVA